MTVHGICSRCGSPARCDDSGVCDDCREVERVDYPDTCGGCNTRLCEIIGECERG